MEVINIIELQYDNNTGSSYWLKIFLKGTSPSVDEDGWLGIHYTTGGASSDSVAYTCLPMQETQISSLVGKIPWRRGNSATHSSILPWVLYGQKEPGDSPWSHKLTQKLKNNNTYYWERNRKNQSSLILPIGKKKLACPASRKIHYWLYRETYAHVRRR